MEGGKELIFKIIVVGDTLVGKTSIIKRYVNNYFSRAYKSTVGVDFALKVIPLDNKTKVHLQLWDIAGQEKFGSMTKIFYKQAVGALIVFDVTEVKSFQNVNKWVMDIREKLRPDGDIPILLIGNKADMSSKLVSQQQMDEALTNTSS